MSISPVGFYPAFLIKLACQLKLNFSIFQIFFRETYLLVKEIFDSMSYHFLIETKET